MEVTIKDIARQAGVSISTASNVLNNKTGIIKASEETRQRIIKTARELDYSPSIMARGLRSGKSFLAGMMLPAIYGSFIPEILQGAEDILNENNYNMILCTYKNISEFRGKWKILCSKKVDGIITLPSREEAFIDSYAEMRTKIPLVFTAGRIDTLDVPFAYVPPVEIATIAARYLLQNGHRNIGILGPRRGEFLESFSNEINKCSDAKYSVSKELTTVSSAIPEFMRMLKEFKEMTAVLAYNDEVAAAVIYEAGKMGIRIPENLSVLGIDDLPICKMVRPNITTIAQPRYEQGSEAARLLMDIINKKHISGGKSLSPTLVERESCRNVNRSNP